MDPFHISDVLRSKKSLHLFSGKWKLPQIYFLCSHLPQQWKKNPWQRFYDILKGWKYIESDYSDHKKESIKFAVALWDFVWETLMRQH